MKTPQNFCGFMQMSKRPGGTDGSIGVKIVIPFCFSVKQPANLICSQECLHKMKNSSVPMSRRHIRTDKRLYETRSILKKASNDAYNQQAGATTKEITTLSKEQPHSSF